MMKKYIQMLFNCHYFIIIIEMSNQSEQKKMPNQAKQKTKPNSQANVISYEDYESVNKNQSEQKKMPNQAKQKTKPNSQANVNSYEDYESVNKNQSEQKKMPNQAKQKTKPNSQANVISYEDYESVNKNQSEQKKMPNQAKQKTKPNSQANVNSYEDYESVNKNQSEQKKMPNQAKQKTKPNSQANVISYEDYESVNKNQSEQKKMPNQAKQKTISNLQAEVYYYDYYYESANKNQSEQKKMPNQAKQKANNQNNKQGPQVGQSLKNNKNNGIQNHAVIEKNINSYEEYKKLKEQYYKFFKQKNIIQDPQKYVSYMPSDEEFKKHKIKFLQNNKINQDLYSFNQPYIRIKRIQRQGTIVDYFVIIGKIELEITLLNIDQDAKVEKKQDKIGEGSFGSVRIESQNKRMFVVKRQKFKNKYQEFDMMANKYEINEVITQLAIYKICSLLKIGPAAETQIGFDLICYRDCIQFQIQYCMKIGDSQQGIFVDENKFQKQIKQCLLTLHSYHIIHKDIKPANILFSIKYNKYVFTDFGLSHPVNEIIGLRSKTHCQGTKLFMSKQMLQIEKGKIGDVHLYGNDVFSLSISLQKMWTNQKIEQGLKQFQKVIKKQINTKYEYEYLKLKYFCIKPDSKMEEVQNYWKYMNSNRREQLIAIVDKSIEYHKIKSVYNYLSKTQEFKKYNLQSLRIQSQSIKHLKIKPQIKQPTQLQLRNKLRVYGYSLYIKDTIIKLKLQQKYKYVLEKIDQIININSINSKQVDYREIIIFENYINYIKQIKTQLASCQKTRDFEGMFQKYMIILQHGNMEEKIDIIQRLKIFKYERKKEEKIEQIIKVINIKKSKQKINQFMQLMKVKDQQRDQIIYQKDLDYKVGGIYYYIGKYEIALQYYSKSLNFIKSLYGQQHPNIIHIYNNIGLVYNSMGKYETGLQYYTKSFNMQLLFYGQQNPSVAVIHIFPYIMKSFLLSNIIFYFLQFNPFINLLFSSTNQIILVFLCFFLYYLFILIVYYISSYFFL